MLLTYTYPTPKKHETERLKRKRDTLKMRHTNQKKSRDKKEH